MRIEWRKYGKQWMQGLKDSAASLMHSLIFNSQSSCKASAMPSSLEHCRAAAELHSVAVILNLLLLLIVSCSDNVEPQVQPDPIKPTNEETYNPVTGEVTATLALNFAAGNESALTRSSAATVQLPATTDGSNFLGMQDMTLITLQGTPDKAAFGKRYDLGTLEPGQIGNGARPSSRVYTKIEVPVGTDNMLFYGRALRPASVTDEDKEERGSVSFSVGDDIASTTFALQPRPDTQLPPFIAESAMRKGLEEPNDGGYPLMYPAELTYWVSSPLRTTDAKSPEVPSNTVAWDAAGSWSADGWASGSAVKESTRTIALQNNVNYGTALLESTVVYADALAGSQQIRLIDNRANFRKDMADQVLAVNGDELRVTGILVYNQPARVGWDFTAPAASHQTTIYDNRLISGSISRSTQPEVNAYTMVWDNYRRVMPGSDPIGRNDVVTETYGQNRIVVALEIENRLADFYGQTGLIPFGQHFYLATVLDPPVKAKMPWPDGTYRFPPLLDDGTEADIPRVFVQDFITHVRFTIAATSLRHALITPPSPESDPNDPDDPFSPYDPYDPGNTNPENPYYPDNPDNPYNPEDPEPPDEPDPPGPSDPDDPDDPDEPPGPDDPQPEDPYDPSPPDWPYTPTWTIGLLTDTYWSYGLAYFFSM